MPNKFFRIEMLPAIEGDALWITYGTEDTERRILIDGGPIGAYDALEKKLKTLPEGDKRIELLVNTHIDTDHSEGLIRAMAPQKNRWLFAPQDIWFNGWKHLKKTEMLGGREGEYVSALISRRTPDTWNNAFNKKAVVIKPDKPLPVIYLDDDVGMKITLLSPEPDNLLTMADKWAKDVEQFGLEPGNLDDAWQNLVDNTKYRVEKGMLGGDDDFGKKLEKQLNVDQSLANGTSIAFLAEYGGKSCLFLGDAHKDVICKSIKKLIPKNQKKLKVDAVKVAHHGSRSNISKELVGLLDTKNYLISTNGIKHNHPHKSAINAIINWSAQVPEFWFNYKSKQTLPWSKAPAEGEKKYTAHYPVTAEGGIAIEL